MAVYQVVYIAEDRKYIMTMKATSENHVRKQMKKFFKNMDYYDGVVTSINRIE